MTPSFATAGSAAGALQPETGSPRVGTAGYLSAPPGAAGPPRGAPAPWGSGGMFAGTGAAGGDGRVVGAGPWAAAQPAPTNKLATRPRTREFMRVPRMSWNVPDTYRIARRPAPCASRPVPATGRRRRGARGRPAAFAGHDGSYVGRGISGDSYR